MASVCVYPPGLFSLKKFPVGLYLIVQLYLDVKQVAVLHQLFLHLHVQPADLRIAGRQGSNVLILLPDQLGLQITYAGLVHRRLGGGGGHRGGRA